MAWGQDGLKGPAQRIWLGNWSIAGVCWGMADAIYLENAPTWNPVQYWSYTHREREREREIYIYTHVYIHTYRQTYIHTDRHTDIQTDIQTYNTIQIKYNTVQCKYKYKYKCKYKYNTVQYKYKCNTIQMQMQMQMHMQYNTIHYVTYLLHFGGSRIFFDARKMGLLDPIFLGAQKKGGIQQQLQEYYGEAGTLTFTTPEPMADAGTTRTEVFFFGASQTSTIGWSLAYHHRNAMIRYNVPHYLWWLFPFGRTPM